MKTEILLGNRREFTLGQAQQQAGTGMRPQPGIEEEHVSFYAKMEMSSLPAGLGSVVESKKSV